MGDSSDDRNGLTPETAKELVEGWLSQAKNTKGHIKAGDWMDSIVPYLQVHSVPSASMPHPAVTFTFAVQPAHCNRLETLHGGCAASVFDFCTSMPLLLVACPGFWQLIGVSRTLNVTYLRPALAGEEVLVECEAVAIGKMLATIKATMRRKSDGAVLMLAEHGKFNIDPQPAKL